jgi:hypothetical protein
LAAVTETIDRHAAVTGAMGERMVLYRMPALDDEGRLAQARAALANTGRQEAIRAELANAVTTFITESDLPDEPEGLDEAETTRSHIGFRDFIDAEQGGRPPAALGHLRAIRRRVSARWSVEGACDGANRRSLRSPITQGGPQPHGGDKELPVRQHDGQQAPHRG